MRKYILFLLLPLAGCAAINGIKEAYAPKTSEYVATKAVQTSDSFYKNTRVDFPTYNLRHFTNYKEITGRSNWLAPDTSIKPVALYNEKACNIYIDFNMLLDEWAFYSSAIDENGKKIEFIERDQKVNAAEDKYSKVSISEKFSLRLPENYLTSNRGKNPQIEVQGKRDSFRFYLPDYYIDGMLKYFEDNNISCK